MTPIPEDSDRELRSLPWSRNCALLTTFSDWKYVIFRPHNVYGEKQNIGDRYRNVVGIFMNQILKGEPMTNLWRWHQQRAFTHIDDVAPIIAECVDYPAARNELFNIGADVPYTVNELAQVVAGAMGAECKVEHLDARNEVQIAFSDHSKAQSVFGKRNEVALEEGIQSMADWVKTHGARESSIFEGIEVAKNMPNSWAKVMRTAEAQR